jgi:hypothetical protein
VLFAVIAASNSDISGPPTIRGGIPWANPSSYIGASTSVGTPVALAICIPMFVALAQYRCSTCRPEFPACSTPAVPSSP